MSVDVVLIRGAPGAGKSQVAKCLSSYFPRGAKVEVDSLRGMVISVDWTNQQEHINLLQVAAGVTRDFLRFGFRPVIVVDTFSGDKINRFVATLRQLEGSPSIGIFGLYASANVLRARLQKRPPGDFKDFEISKKLNDDVLRIKNPEEHQIDTSGLSPMQTAEEVYRCLGRFDVGRITPPGLS